MEMNSSTDVGSGSSSDDGRGQSEGSAVKLLSVVIGQRSLFLMHRRHRNVAQRACRWRFVGSVAGLRANWPRDFDQGMRGIMRDYIGVDRQLPAYAEETFERRFRVPRCLFMGVYKTIRDGPFVRQSINATGRPRAPFLQKLVAAFCIVAYGGLYNRADDYVRLSSCTVHLTWRPRSSLSLSLRSGNQCTDGLLSRGRYLRDDLAAHISAQRGSLPEQYV